MPSNGITSDRSAAERHEPRIECSIRRFHPSALPETTFHRPACTNGSPDSAVDLGSGTIYWRYYDYGYSPIQDISSPEARANSLPRSWAIPSTCRRINSRKVLQPCDGPPLLRTMYFATLVWPTSMPSLSSSPWRRGARQSGLARLMSRISRTDLRRDARSPAAPL